MGRLIDEVKALEAISEISHRSQSGEALAALLQASNAIIDLPTADAVTVVRCENCENLRGIGGYCALTGMPMDKDDFCSYGERRRGV